MKNQRDFQNTILFFVRFIVYLNLQNTHQLIGFQTNNGKRQSMNWEMREKKHEWKFLIIFHGK